MTPTWSIRRLSSLDEPELDDLADVLLDAVNGGASVGFMRPLERAPALAFWRRVAEGVAAGERALLVAQDAQGICGTVQLVLALPDNQPHRADLVKMLVHRRARRQGLGAALMRAAEGVARDCGRTLLVLDAVTGGDAARLYARLGWVRVGDIPRYALMPDGASCSTTYFYRDLSVGSGRTRMRMRADLRAPRSIPSDPLARRVEPADRPALATLMLDAYRGSADDQGEGPAEAAAEVARLFDGAYGPLDAACSEVVVRENAVVSATLITLFEGRPLVAFSMTAPPWKRRGLARGGLLRAMAGLRAAGHHEVWLAVSASNTPARRLYESLGFREASG